MSPDIIEVDGAYGEGGGQILRTALSLSCLTGKPFHIFNIRKGREKPGVMPQHLMSITACQRISSARVEGAKVGSLDVSFYPSRVKGGSLALDIGTAGSVCLILHALLPPLCAANEPSSITLRGGTHVPFSPPFHHFQRVFLPALTRTGRKAEAELVEWGFYPKGGGHVRVRIPQSPVAAVQGEDIERAASLPEKQEKDTVPHPGDLGFQKRGDLRTLSLLSCVGGLPLSIAERQMNQGLKTLKRAGIEAEISQEVFGVPSRGNGTFFFILAEYENTMAGFGSLGAIGKRAEDVARDAAGEFLEFHGSEAAVDPYLADQLLVYLALEGKGVYTTSRLTAHILTNAWAIGKFLPESHVVVKGDEGKPGEILVASGG